MSKRKGSFVAAAGLACVLACCPGTARAQRGPATATSPDKRLQATASDNAVLVSEAATQRVLVKFQGHTGKVTCLAFSPDGKVLASGSQDRTVGIWDPATGKQLWRVQAPAGILAVSFSPDGSRLTARDANRATRTWEVATGKIVSEKK